VQLLELTPDLKKRASPNRTISDTNPPLDTESLLGSGLGQIESILDFIRTPLQDYAVPLLFIVDALHLYLGLT
jgi:hypothetical protein